MGAMLRPKNVPHSMILKRILTQCFGQVFRAKIRANFDGTKERLNWYYKGNKTITKSTSVIFFSISEYLFDFIHKSYLDEFFCIKSLRF